LSGITPVKDFAGFSVNTQITDHQFEKLPKKKEYNDPLMQWPVRGMAFTNDIGAAIMDIAPKAGTAFWVPALMYFGADIYDKYRNDKESYDPSARRGLKQATFQAFASILFPIVAVHAGQKAFSIGARIGKEKLSLQTQEEVIAHHREYMSHTKTRQHTAESYKQMYGEALDNYIDETSRQIKNRSWIKRINTFIFGSKHPEELDSKRRTPIHEYINKRIDEMFESRALLVENLKPKNMTDKMFAKFQHLKEVYKNDPAHANDFIHKAAKDTLKAVEDNKIFKIKLLKTLGGFVALGALIQPIDKFVEHVIIDKFVDPGLKRFDNGQINRFKEKTMKS